MGSRRRVNSARPRVHTLPGEVTAERAARRVRLTATRRRPTSTIRQPPANAISRSSWSGLTATGLPTIASIGSSLTESEYAKHCAKS